MQNIGTPRVNVSRSAAPRLSHASLVAAEAPTANARVLTHNGAMAAADASTAYAAAAAATSAADSALLLTEVRTLTRLVGQMHEEQRKRDETIEEMSMQLEKLNKAYTDLRREQTDNLS